MRVENPPAEFQLTASRTLLYVLFAPALLALCLLTAVPLWWLMKTIGLIIVAGFLLAVLRRYRATVPVTLCFDGGQWFLLRGTRHLPLQLHGQQFIISQLVIVYFKQDDGKDCVLPLFADALPPGQHRLLRKLLIEITDR